MQCLTKLFYDVTDIHFVILYNIEIDLNIRNTDISKKKNQDVLQENNR